MLGCEVKQPENDRRQRFKQEKVIVKTVTLRKEPMIVERVSNGKLISYRKQQLSLKTSGVVKNITKQNVIQQGCLILDLETEDAKIELDNARLQLDKAKLDLDDFLLGRGINTKDTSLIDKDLLKLATIKSGYAMALNTYQKTLLKYNNSKLYAPFSGKIVLENCLPGAWLGNGALIGTIYDDTKLFVNFSLLESEVGKVSIHQSIAVSPFAMPNDTIFGKITSITPCIDENGLVNIQGIIDNPGNLVDGMNTNVIIKSKEKESFVVPRSAVVLRQGLEVLFRLINGKAYWTYVNVINENSTSYAVKPNQEKRAELNDGDIVITSNNLNLAHDTEVMVDNK